MGDTYESDKQYSIVTDDMVYQSSTPGESNGSQEFILNGDYRNKKVSERTCNTCKYRCILHTLFYWLEAEVEGLHDLYNCVTYKDDSTSLDDVCLTSFKH